MIMRFSRLLDAIRRVDPGLLEGVWRVFDIDGTGPTIVRLSDELDGRQPVLVEGRRLFDELGSEQESVWDVLLEKQGSALELGVFDSTFLFVRSTDRSLLERLASLFACTEIDDYQPPPGRRL